MNDKKRFSASTPTVSAPADGTPPERQIILPLTPPATDECQSTSNPQSPVCTVLDLINRQRHKLTGQSRQLKVTPLEYKNILARLEGLPGLKSFVDDKLRLEYDPLEKVLYAPRTPTATHKSFSEQVSQETKAQLDRIASGSDEAARFAARISSVRSGSIQLREFDSDDDIEIDQPYIQRQPDEQFQHEEAEYPGVMYEIAWSQDGRELGKAAWTYIQYSNANIKAVVGFELGYGNKEARISMWQPHYLKERWNLEVQNDRHPPDGPTTPPVASETPTCEAETLMAPELSRPQNPSVTASLDEDNTKVAFSSVTKPQGPPNPPVIINAQGTRASPDAGAKNPLLPASAAQETLKASSSHVAHAQVPPSVVPVTNAQAGPAGDHPRAKEPLPATEFAVQQTQAISTSQRLWNAAYDSLEKDDNTAKLVRSYVKILTKVLKDEKASDPSALDDISADLKDPIRRQTYLQDLVKKGQKNIDTTSKIAEGVDNVIEYIDKAKDMISVAIGNIPQAALPWAGVCLGLQILSNPGKATRSNLSGIAHVISRMDWYCALTEHLLDNNNIIFGDKSFEEVIEKLEGTIITLYEALLQYQIKSALRRALKLPTRVKISIQGSTIGSSFPPNFHDDLNPHLQRLHLLGVRPRMPRLEDMKTNHSQHVGAMQCIVKGGRPTIMSDRAANGRRVQNKTLNSAEGACGRAYGSAKNFEVQLAPFCNKFTSDKNTTFFFTQGTVKCSPPLGFNDYFRPAPHLRDFLEGENAEDILRELMPTGDASIRKNIKQSIDKIYQTMDEHGPFDGICAYSEWTVAAGVLIMDELRRLKTEGRPRQIKRAVFFAGWPPLDV
ncbi:hypothetical protein G7Y89_g9119 [Cudoniella acicularis]|uniref:Uncharacterized protein n=1 Tax=Cudoniella acicularis TaxID=354080 RepID=A0A8H4RF90_9HELO|nr:hypothetical protein G7Y89_g9119 [Cudoniella acicularis]